MADASAVNALTDEAVCSSASKYKYAVEVGAHGISQLIEPLDTKTLRDHIDLTCYTRRIPTQ